MTRTDSTTDPVEGLTRALDATGHLVAGVADDTWSASTPCPEWDARELVRHLVGVHRLVHAALTGGTAPDPDGDHLGADPAGAYRRHAAALATAFARPGTLEAPVTVPFGTVPGAVALELQITETLAHGWDLARATGQEVTDLPADVAERALAFSRDALGQLPPERSPFAAPQPVADEAPAPDRLAALLGRPVSGAVGR